ncbi:MAG: GntR family transcriptional regulator [Anaerolineae bacterium]|nr:GntR family transcriptional regulator [Anaerolineae bacterium]
MGKRLLYQEIVESICQEIRYGILKPNAELPTVREMADRWCCAPGTVLHAYQDLAQQGLVISRQGAGTRVAPQPPCRSQSPLRKATLMNQAELFLLSALTSGHTVEEIDCAVRAALDRWRTLVQEPEAPPCRVLRFVGSHDLALSLLAARLAERMPGHTLHLSFVGSLGGLIALARREADIAGVHLWDEETNSYNRPFVRRLLPGRRVALVNLANRQIGLIVAPGNPLDVAALADLPRGNVRFINRQAGAGTRVWLDAQLCRMNIEAGKIEGYGDEALTHSEVAGAITEGRANVGLGIEAAALAYGLDFVPLTSECYDLVVPIEQWETEPMQALVAGLSSDETKTAISQLGGYDTTRTGSVEWVS